MKPTELLTELGRPIAYYPGLKKIVRDSTVAAILLSQLFYWRGKEGDPNGWLKKNSKELREETGLSYNEQKTARRILRSLGFLKEKNFRLEHRMGFKLNTDAIDKAWES